MAIELLVILATANAPSATAWNKALEDSRSPAKIEMPERLDLLTHTGFVPVALGNTKSGFYFLREPYSEAVASYPAFKGYQISAPVVYSLSYGDFKECAAAFYAASVLVANFGGTALETEGGIIISSTQMSDAARVCQQASHGQ